MRGQERFKVGGVIKTQNGSIIYSKDAPLIQKNHKLDRNVYADSEFKVKHSMEMSALG
jgi:hypothetical protein